MSAAYRLALYQQAYGWTELRFYVAAGRIWLAVCLAAAAAALSTDRARWLPQAVVLSALGVGLAVNLVRIVLHDGRIPHYSQRVGI